MDVTRNPIVVRELGGQRRTGRQTVVLFLTLLGLALLTYWFYNTALAAGRDVQAFGAQSASYSSVFSGIVFLQLFYAFITVAGSASGSIASEREQRTLDVVLTTPITTEQFVFGKIASAIVPQLLFVAAALPFQAIAAVLGGVSWSNWFMEDAVLVMTVIMTAVFCVWISSRVATSRVAHRLAYGIIFGLNIGGPILFLFGGVTAALTSSALAGRSGSSGDLVTLFIGSVVASLDPWFAYAASLEPLQDGSSLVLLNASGVLQGTNLTVIQPWLLLVAFYVIGTVFFFKRTVRQVHRLGR